DEKARRVIDRLSYRYPYEKLTQVAAARSVTQWTKEQKPAPSMETELDVREARDGTLREPRWVAEELKPSAVDIGNTTHLVLQYLDFDGVGEGAADEVEVAEQINGLVSRKLSSAG